MVILSHVYVPLCVGRSKGKAGLQLEYRIHQNFRGENLCGFRGFSPNRRHSLLRDAATVNVFL